jgi:hypothetical protein
VVPTGKAKAHDFIDIVSNLINWCTDRIKMRTISEDFFPKRALMLAWISEIWAVGCQRIGRNFELLPRIVTIVCVTLRLCHRLHIHDYISDPSSTIERAARSQECCSGRCAFYLLPAAYGYRCTQGLPEADQDAHLR